VPNNFTKYVAGNFRNPNGIGGKIATIIMNIINRSQYNIVLKNISIKPTDVVLDIGFGNGYLIKKLFKENINSKIYGIEISRDMLNKVIAKNKQKIYSGTLRLFLENINKTSFEDNLFDKIYTVNTIYFWNDLDKCFSEIKRTLKQNGIFINAFYDKKHLDKIIFSKYGFNKYTMEEVKIITEKNGLRIIETIEIAKNKSYCIISKNIK
jgi:ubiquinone/menaquinone biosynthesis C-methylase UbiE